MSAVASSGAIPRIVVAGVASGVGKTTVAVALAAALRRRGLRVVAFKCGPDYLDPTYHARATGGPSHNLDGWMMGREAVLATFARAAAGADLAIIEGVMGLYDGASPVGEEGSTAEIAKWLDAPVLAVIDAGGMARTIAAVVHGLATFDPAIRIGGVIANRVGSSGHLDLLRRAVSTPPIVGGLTKDDALAFPERHLGLRTASEDAIPDALIAAWAERAAASIDLDAVLAIARTAPALPIIDEPAITSGQRCRIGIARDDAFHFYYDDNLRRLEALGAELVPFSPIRDVRLPDVGGLYLGGGYPEVHAAVLAGNSAMRAAIAAFARRRPIYAECGGLMYLADAIVTRDGERHPMVGIVPGIAIMHDRLQALGYVEVETQVPTLLGGAGVRFRGHQFRYSTLDVAAEVPRAYKLRKRRDGATALEGYAIGNLVASYVHAHWASNPTVPASFVAACAT
jgi:cobyrinic acid a,c-diamide synthase